MHLYNFVPDFRRFSTSECDPWLQSRFPPMSTSFLDPPGDPIFRSIVPLLAPGNRPFQIARCRGMSTPPRGIRGDSEAFLIGVGWNRHQNLNRRSDVQQRTGASEDEARKQAAATEAKRGDEDDVDRPLVGRAPGERLCDGVGRWA